MLRYLDLKPLFLLVAGDHMYGFPVPDPVVEAERRRIPIPGEVPSPTVRIAGCPFRSRCAKAMARCAVEAPVLEEHRPGHLAACQLPEA